LFSYLLSRIRGQIEDQHGQEGDAHAGDDQVDGVEQRLPPHGHVECDVQVGFIAASVELDIANGGNLQDVPLHRHVELGQVHADLHAITAQFLINVS